MRRSVLLQDPEARSTAPSGEWAAVILVCTATPCPSCTREFFVRLPAITTLSDAATVSQRQDATKFGGGGSV